MKINWKAITITSLLLVLLGVVILVETGLFISGPMRKYEHDIEQHISAIHTKYKDIKSIERHVFYYTTYVGQDDKMVVWFNEKDKAIVSRKKETLQMESAKQKAESEYGIKNAIVALGYGYDNPVYVVNGDNACILLDYDSLKEVYYLKEGEV